MRSEAYSMGAGTSAWEQGTRMGSRGTSMGAGTSAWEQGHQDGEQSHQTAPEAMKMPDQSGVNSGRRIREAALRR